MDDGVHVQVEVVKLDLVRVRSGQVDLETPEGLFFDALRKYRRVLVAQPAVKCGDWSHLT